MSLYVAAGKIKKIWRTDDNAALHEVKNLWTDAGQVFSSGPTVDVFDVYLSGLLGEGTFHSFVTLSPPPGEVWHVEIEGTISGTLNWSGQYPRLRVGGSWSGGKAPGPVSHSGTITSASRHVGIETNADLSLTRVGFTGTVTVTYP